MSVPTLERDGMMQIEARDYHVMPIATEGKNPSPITSISKNECS